MSEANTIQFILNAEQVSTEVAAMMSVLDYVRDQQQLSGTKEGCRVGDCGACMVLVGELDKQQLEYLPVTACLMPMGELNGKHLITIEGMVGKQLTAVQSALIECGAIQCGYCTPGFVMALTAWMLNPSKGVGEDALQDAISGNLCRCTGYRPIKQAARQLAKQRQLLPEKVDNMALLCKHFALPDYLMDIKTRLQALQTPGRKECAAEVVTHTTIVAGATDLYLQKGTDPDNLKPHFLLSHAAQTTVQIINQEIVIDASMTFEAFFNDSIIRQCLPDIYAYRKQMASWPIRCRATLGGNLANASPVADLACLLLALDATIELRAANAKRSIALKAFYSGYKRLNKQADEIISTIRIPCLTTNTRINWIKVSKRFSLDIASVCSALKIEANERRIVHSHLVFGGVAAIPLYLQKTSVYLRDKNISIATVLAAANMAQTEINPRSDVRGSASYRRLLVRQIIFAHFMQQFPEYLDEAALYATLR